jgi:hypothetical protein
MPGQRIKWDSPASETVTGAPADVTLEKWAKLEYETGSQTQRDLAKAVGCGSGVMSSHLKLVPSQVEPQQRKPQAAAPVGPAPAPAAALPRPADFVCGPTDERRSRDYAGRIAAEGAADEPPRESAPTATGEPLEDDSDADLPVEGPREEPSGVVEVLTPRGEWIPAPGDAEVLDAFLEFHGLSRKLLEEFEAGFLQAWARIRRDAQEPSA